MTDPVERWDRREVIAVAPVFNAGKRQRPCPPTGLAVVVRSRDEDHLVREG